MATEVNADRWDKILDSALEVFAKKGYQSSSMSDIAQAAGLKKPSLYHYVQSKEDLLEAIIVRSHKRLTALLNGIPPVDSAIEMVRAIIYTHVLFNINYGTEASVFQADFRTLSRERQTAIRESLGDYDRSLQALIEEAQRRKEISTAVDAKLAVLWLMGSANHLVRWYRPKPGSDPETVAAQFADLSASALLGLGFREQSQPTAKSSKAKTARTRTA